jgi:hypothetical protein
LRLVLFFVAIPAKSLPQGLTIRTNFTDAVAFCAASFADRVQHQRQDGSSRMMPSTLEASRHRIESWLEGPLLRGRVGFKRLRVMGALVAQGCVCMVNELFRGAFVHDSSFGRSTVVYDGSSRWTSYAPCMKSRRAEDWCWMAQDGFDTR